MLRQSRILSPPVRSHHDTPGAAHCATACGKQSGNHYLQLGVCLRESIRDAFCLPQEGLSQQLNTSASKHKSHCHAPG